MLSLSCPRCRKPLKAAEEHAGRKVRCPGCKHEFPIPAGQKPEPPVRRPAAPAPLPPSPIPEPLPVSEAVRAAEASQEQLLEVDEEPEPEAEPGEEAPRRRKKRRKRRRRKSRGGLLDTLHYFTGSFGVFPFVLAGLVAVWLLMGVLSLLVPPVAMGVTVAGFVLYASGWLWLLIVAFGDDTFHGILCVATHFYWIAYVFINLEEAWRPVALMVLGMLVASSGAILMAALAASS
jgi:hypothetical protein